MHNEREVVERVAWAEAERSSVPCYSRLMRLERSPAMATSLKGQARGRHH